MGQLRGLAKECDSRSLRAKNHHGSCSAHGTEVAALFYSLIEGAKLAGVEPDVFRHTAARFGIRRERSRCLELAAA